MFASFIIRLFQLVFSAGIVFFSPNKSAGRVFCLVFSTKRTGPNTAKPNQIITAILPHNYHEMFKLCIVPCYLSHARELEMAKHHIQHSSAYVACCCSSLRAMQFEARVPRWHFVEHAASGHEITGSDAEKRDSPKRCGHACRETGPRSSAQMRPQ